LCGDEITIHAHVDGGRVSEITFEGSGCSISQASASMLTQAVGGKSVEDAGDYLEEAGDYLKDQAERLSNEAQKTAKRARQQVENVVDKAGDVVADAVKSAKALV